MHEFQGGGWGGVVVEENTPMTALKDAESDQWYIFKCQAYLPLHPYMYKYPPFHFTDGWMQILNAF